MLEPKECLSLIAGTAFLSVVQPAGQRRACQANGERSCTQVMVVNLFGWVKLGGLAKSNMLGKF